MKIILAHGILGPFDELLYLLPEAIFILTLLLSWLRFRNKYAYHQPAADNNSTQLEAHQLDAPKDQTQ